MQDPQTRPEIKSGTQVRLTDDQRTNLNPVGNDTGAPRTDASSGPLLPQSKAAPGDANYHGGRRILGTSLGIFLPAVILLLIAIAVILYIAW